MLREIVPAEHGVIVRTAAEGTSEEQLRADVERLAKPQDVPAPQRIETGGVVAHPVRIGPGKRGKPCVEAFGREIHAGHRDV